ncbi:MAG: transposase, IS605 OrfB family, central region [halophilic archaeon J07HX64]|jgi:transposase, IS605 OrfB family, central region|nr:MAG: transposase, IS605 OrfB family, central region [halophilic archaeon J07HX64]
MTQLTEQFHLPDDSHDACDRLTTLVKKHSRRLLAEEYWSDGHLDAISDHTGQSYTYIRDNDREDFADVTEYVYDRFKRCVYHRVTHVLDAHTDEFHAFQFVTDTVDERKIRRIGWKRLRTRLYDEDTPYIEWRVLESVVDQFNDYYDRHGRFPEAYTELVKTPEPNGTLPYAPDKGDYHIHELTIEDSDLRFVLNAPNSLSPGSHYDWTKHELRLPIHPRFQRMIDAGDAKAPILHASEHGYTLDVPVAVPKQDTETVADRVLAVDLGVKKQATAVVLDSGDGGTHDQLMPPQFLDHPAKNKLFRLKADAEGINDRLAELRRQGKDHTDRFDHLVGEFRQTRQKERRLREQIQHHIANQLVWLAAENNCETIIFESLGQIDSSETDGAIAWSISSWARGELLDHVEYKTGLLGIEVTTVNPWGTSRYCPRCGERGRTVNAPNDHEQNRHGGHFHCRTCGYECDRDVVGAVNVGRKHLSESKMEEANPAEYISTGNHASFPSSTRDARSAGVQSATDQQEPASGRQTHLSQYCSASLTAKRRETDTGGLHQNRGSNKTQQWVSGSVTRYILASTTECG